LFKTKNQIISSIGKRIFVLYPFIMIIAPSILSADFLNLNHAVQLINQSNAHWFHIDVMDGHFVPNISFGIPVLKAISNFAEKPLDVHLMIEKPDRYIKAFSEAGATSITIHAEADNHLHRTIQGIHSLGLKAGIALNPHTPLHCLDYILPELDLVLIMSVNPGFGGQTFIKSSLNKIESLKNKIININSNALIQVDGGVNLENAENIKNAGADVLVAGNAIFNATNPAETIQLFCNI
jgi:ribulose-phosphate 3-epimerase